MTNYPQENSAYAPHPSQTPQGPTPEQEGKLASLVTFTWITAAVYTVTQIASIAATGPVQASLGVTMGPEYNAVIEQAGGPNYIPSIIGLVLGLGIFVLVGLLLKNRKNGGRITGFVFAGLGIAAAGFSLLGAFIYPQPWMVIMLVLCLAWMACGIIWIVKAANRDVAAALTAR